MKNTTSLLFGTLISLAVGLSACDLAVSEEHSDNPKVEKGVYVRDELPVQHGMELFNQHCASCHDFSENGIGPNLAGVTSKVDKKWLVDFIRNPSALIESGDPRAVQLF